MARINAANTDKVLKIDKFLGVNECPDGDTNIRVGEASTMTNFKITSDYNLQKRHGTQNVANLFADYIINVSETYTTVLTEYNQSVSTFVAYPSRTASTGGLISLTGSPTTVNYSNLVANVGMYWKDAHGNAYQLGTCTVTTSTDPGKSQYRWKKWNTVVEIITDYAIISTATGGEASGFDGYTDYNFDSTTGIFTNSGTYKQGGYLGETLWSASGNVLVRKIGVPGGYEFEYYTSYLTDPHPVNVKGSTFIGYVYGEPGAYPSNGAQIDSGTYYWYDTKEYVTFEWKFYPLYLTTSTPDNTVRGIWSGRVGEDEYMCAACNNNLWILSETDGVWSKQQIGTVNTASNKVHMFGFDSKLYILDGEHYMQWDGTVLTTVDGYRPLTHVGRSYDGTTAGTLLERINMLNGQRRVWFSPPGGQATFTLPEKSLASVDYAKVIATGAALTISTSDLTAGTTTLSAAPESGTNTIEIGYTVSTTYRSTIEAMTLSEFFGINDRTIMFYGDGSNEIYYSEIDYDGQARADYIPDLNVIHVRDSNTPVTDLIRHHNRLLAFKESSAYGISYDTIDVTYGANTFITSAFYLSTINRDVGSAGYGQAQLIDNKVRTLNGRSIYEWSATDSSGNVTADQRNAKVISDKVQNTLRELDFSNAVTFWDTINRESYIVENGIAIINNLENGTWYIYRDFPAICMIMYKDELYFGTEDGFIRHLSRDYLHDVGENIQCYWESGAMDYGSAYRRKYSDYIWTVLKPEANSSIYLTIVTDKNKDFDEAEATEDSRSVKTGFFSYLNLSYPHFTYNINSNPHTQRRKIKAKKFVWQKIIYSTATNDTTATLLKTEIKYRETGVAK